MDDVLARLAASVLAGEVAEGKRLAEHGLAGGLSAKVILDQGLMSGMDTVGRRFRDGDMFLPEVLMSARTMQASVDILRPELARLGVKAHGRVVLGTVKGDLHDIGKSLVGIMLQGAGFEVIDLGIDVPPERFVAAVQAEQPDLVGMSALLTTTLGSMAATVKALNKAGVRGKVGVMVGGAPVTQQFADEIGADGYASNAGSAAELAKRLMGAVV
jgi:5-methyltetrahydrofolate--homocysteine methyltransferase